MSLTPWDHIRKWHGLKNLIAKRDIDVDIRLQLIISFLSCLIYVWFALAVTYYESEKGKMFIDILHLSCILQLGYLLCLYLTSWKLLLATILPYPMLPLWGIRLGLLFANCKHMSKLNGKSVHFLNSHFHSLASTMETTGWKNIRFMGHSHSA